MGALDALAAWLNFFDIKTRHYGLMRYATKQFDLNQLFLWKFFCGSLILTFSVVVPCMWLPWEGFTFDGREKPPPILHFTVLTGLLSSTSMFVATFNLFRALDRSRFVVKRKICALSWDMVDWVLFEVSTTATMAAFVMFWLVQMPMSVTRVHLLRIEGVLVQFAVTCVDFYFTTPQFRKNHVFLALLWPSFWLMLQFVWIVTGHQPTNEATDFHTWHAPLIASILLLVVIGSFFALQRIAVRLQAAQAATTTQLDDISKAKFMATNVEADGDVQITPGQPSSVVHSTLANFELMAKTQRGQLPLISLPRDSSLMRDSTDSEMGVYRIGSEASSSADSHRVIAMGSWVGEVPAHVHNPEPPRENSCLMSNPGG